LFKTEGSTGRFSKKKNVTSRPIPRPFDQYCCTMHAGIRTEIADFFESISKQSNITTLNWGKGGVQVLFEMSVTGRVFF